VVTYELYMCNVALSTLSSVEARLETGSADREREY